MEISEERLDQLCDDPLICISHEQREICHELRERRKADRWIPVSEGLPNELEPCLVIFDDGEIFHARRDVWGQFETLDEEALLGPTHWRPLPAPPEVSNG